MKIAIDGRVLNDTAGKAVYTRSVLAAWRNFSDHQYVVYGHLPKEGESWPANWSFRPVASRLGTFRHLTEDVLFSPSSYLTTIVSNRPTLTTIHDLVIYKIAVKLPLKTVLAERFLLRRAVKRSQAITVQTDSVRQDLIGLFPEAEAKTYRVSPGVSPLVSREALPNDDEQDSLLASHQVTRPFFLFVGTMEPRKNVARLVQAYLELPEDVRMRYQLVLAGKLGWVDRELSQAVTHLPEGVLLTGRVDDKVLASFYNRASAVVYPSLYEGVGYPVLEGYYWQKPVITSNTSSLKEVGGEAAVLVNPENVREISSAMLRVTQDSDWVAQRVQLGTAELARYSWDKAAQSYLEILEKIQ